MSYLRQRFHAALQVLVGHADMKQRLAHAYLEHLGELDEQELPEGLRERFAELRETLHRVAPLNGEGPVRASIRKMSLQDAAECAGIILDLHAEIAADPEATVPLRVVDQEDEAPPVPKFLVKS